MFLIYENILCKRYKKGKYIQKVVNYYQLSYYSVLPHKYIDILAHDILVCTNDPYQDNICEKSCSISTPSIILSKRPGYQVVFV